MSVVGEVIVGASLGLVLQSLYQAIKSEKDRSRTTRFILERLKSTIFSITPLVNQLDKLSETMDDYSQRRIIENLKHLLRTAVVLVTTYTELRRRNIIKKLRYKRKLKELEASLGWMVKVNLQVSQSADIKEIMAFHVNQAAEMKEVMAKISETNAKLEEIMRQSILQGQA